jgi:WhiB family transcriptional regulator, redox-sensing transcriptional regulator
MMTMMESEVGRYGGPEEDWRHRSACRNEDRALFFPTSGEEDNEEEPSHADPTVKLICDACPVRAECLEYALDRQIEFGIFAGLTGYERGLIGRKRSRKRCPGCSSEEVMKIGRNQVCGACGISWDVDVPAEDQVD